MERTFYLTNNRRALGLSPPPAFTRKRAIRPVTPGD
jgi:hypothetical protein